MDKSLILAVAGSGKTTLLVERLDLQKRTLVITYTENNYRNLHRKITNRFGHIPPNIRLQTYFTFINSFCYRPYLLLAMNSRGITYDSPRGRSIYAPSSSRYRYLDSTNRVYHGRMADLLNVKGCMPELLKRLRRYFDALYVDEVQDLGGYDFNFLIALCRAELEVLLVGDFYQHTYSTSADGAVNKNLYRELEKYKARIRSAGLEVDSNKLLHSRRCSIEVCQFIQDHLGIEIASSTGRSSKVVVVDNKTEIDRLHACRDTVKLFYNEHHLYGCFSQNWGGSKGIDHFEDVCVVLNNSSWAKHRKDSLKALAPITKNKLYVACSRARGNLFLVQGSLLTGFKTTKEPRR